MMLLYLIIDQFELPALMIAGGDLLGRGRCWIEQGGGQAIHLIGWCRLEQTDESPLWQGIADGSYFYFLHSYTPDSPRHAIASSEFSPAAAAARRTVMGTQFHPEKSGPDGLRVYENFLKLCG